MLFIICFIQQNLLKQNDYEQEKFSAHLSKSILDAFPPFEAHVSTIFHRCFRVPFEKEADSS